MNERHLEFNFKARYFSKGKVDAGTQKIWFVVHGYGQLARFFINKFNVLADNRIYLVAPEGLSKFYLQEVTQRAHGRNDRVGATWMTRENRHADIENYIAYLNQVYRIEVPPHFDGEITLLGFSQGAATVTRWAIEGGIHFHRLILWAGIFPPDMNFEKGHEILKDKKVIEVVGKQDPFLTHERMMEANRLSDLLNIQPEWIEFEGGHEIREDVLRKLMH